MAETWTENAAPAGHSSRCRAVNDQGERCRKSLTLPHEHVSQAPPVRRQLGNGCIYVHVDPAGNPALRRQFDAALEREPQPSDGPDFHSDHAAWERRQAANITSSSSVAGVRGPDEAPADPRSDIEATVAFIADEDNAYRNVPRPSRGPDEAPK